MHILAQLALAFYIMSQGGSGAPADANIDPSNLANPQELQVFIATLIATFAATRQYRAKPWLRVIQRDGIIYFMAIFSSTLIWLLFNQIASNGLKLINAIPDLIFTSVMINRLYLSLKKAGREEDPSNLYLGKSERCGDMELQVMVSHHVTSVIR
ncbi:hypothetical protein H0H92_008624 [Tricholoma furcatifolium]|nr:hypothetical protein H0H92_008624 [Tricholoma furcatifolium]